MFRGIPRRTWMNSEGREKRLKLSTRTNRQKGGNRIVVGRKNTDGTGQGRFCYSERRMRRDLTTRSE